RRAVRGAVVEEVGLRIVGEVAPDGAPTLTPGVTEPRRRARALDLVRRVERLEAVGDAHLVVGTGGVVLPDLFTGVEIVCCHPAANTALATFVTDDDVVVDDEWSVGGRLGDAQVGDLHSPDLFTGVGVECDELTVERVDDDLALGIGEAGRLSAATSR